MAASRSRSGESARLPQENPIQRSPPSTQSTTRTAPRSHLLPSLISPMPLALSRFLLLNDSLPLPLCRCCKYYFAFFHTKSPYTHHTRLVALPPKSLVPVQCPPATSARFALALDQNASDRSTSAVLHSTHVSTLFATSATCQSLPNPTFSQLPSVLKSPFKPFIPKNTHKEIVRDAPRNHRLASPRSWVKLQAKFPLQSVFLPHLAFRLRPLTSCTTVSHQSP